MHPFKYNAKDWLCASLITLLVLMTGAATLTAGLPYWGDDSSAYISEGIAIAEGTFQKQTELNYIMHPFDNISEDAGPEGLVYVWGYPLMLSAVYKLAGFDRVGYTSIIWYKIPLLLGLALSGGAMFLLFRRRFSAGVSAVCALTLCFGANLVKHLNLLYADLPFLFFSILSLLLMEVYSGKALSDNSKKIRLILSALFYGAVLWFTHEVRLNGKTVCMIAAVGHLLFLLKNRRHIKQKDLWLHILPYVIMFFLTFISEHFFLAPASSNMSDVGRTTADMIKDQVLVYWKLIYGYFNGLPRFKSAYTGYILIAACVIGMILKGFRPENAHLTLLLLGTLAVNILLPYSQGLRYLYNILPVLIMFTAYGLQAVWRLLTSRIRLPRLFRTGVKLCAAFLILYLPLLNILKLGSYNLKHPGHIGPEDVYSAEAVDMYRYIQENVPEDMTIAFGKPRALFLNTERVSLRTGYNGHTIAEADYYLEYKTDNEQFTREKEEAAATPKEKVYGNERFTLYRVSQMHSPQ